MAAKKQLRIPGTESKHPKDLETAITTYVEIRDERMAMAKQEVAAKNKLVETMKRHKLKRYVDEDGEFEVIFESAEAETIKVKKTTQSEAAE